MPQFSCYLSLVQMGDKTLSCRCDGTSSCELLVPKTGDKDFDDKRMKTFSFACRRFYCYSIVSVFFFPAEIAKLRTTTFSCLQFATSKSTFACRKLGTGQPACLTSCHCDKLRRMNEHDDTTSSLVSRLNQALADMIC